MLKIILFLIANIIATSCAIDISTERTTIVNENVTKRDLNSDGILSKSFDPSPEYYRGPVSTFERDRNHHGDVVGLHGGPFRPNSYGHDRRYPPKGGEGDTSSYYDNTRRPNVDRISIDHYGPSSFEGGRGGVGYDGPGHPHGHIPYGQPQPIDGIRNYGASGSEFEKHHPPGYYLPEHPVGFDLYNKGYGDYGQSYPSPDYYHSKAELAKSFLIPLAGAAVLGITAALIANPILLQLGTVSSVVGKRRRKRRDLNEQMKLNGKSETHRLAYKGYLRN